MAAQKKIIGLFDFGIGGLTVIKQFLIKKISADLIFLSDRIPFDRNLRYIKNRVLNIVRFLLHKGAETVVFACNTATAAALEECIFKFPNIKFYNVIDSGTVKALRETKNNRIGVIATPLTVNLKIYEKKLKRLNENLRVYQCPLAELAKMIESFCSEDVLLTYLKKELSYFNDKDIDTLILGCTHYPIVSSYIKKTVKNVNIVDPAEELAEEVAKHLKIYDFMKPSTTNMNISIYTYNINLLNEMSAKVLEYPVENIKVYGLKKNHIS
jgi:glutamate racemase